MEKQQWMQHINLKYLVVAVGVAMIWLFNQWQSLAQPSQEDFFASEETIAEVSETYQGIEADNTEEPTIIYAEIKGAVMHPGVYTFHEGDRVMDLIHKAGGPTDEAAMMAINQALLIQDQMSLSVPTYQEWETEQEISDSLTTHSHTVIEAGSEGSAIININTADSSQLQSLPGIGPKKAEAIIAYREEHGSFQATEEMMAISGIGEKTYEKLAPLIKVGP
ncbi:helix-hairpin-helix domain-containing protein [Aerococcaceae bacterium DSM 111020]|nr:helix-hairpin-helix domain-containing protein [Aerococcaceae bacterium DSM 111020]